MQVFTVLVYGLAVFNSYKSYITDLDVLCTNITLSIFLCIYVET